MIGGMHGSMDVRISDDPAGDAARAIADWLREALRERGEAFLAVSGGTTGPPLFAELIAIDLPWERIGVWQVDERVAPDGDDARNAGQLDAIPGHVHLMPVTASPPDLPTAAAQYGAGLPPRLDVVHLGLGDDGHTASWPPGADAIVDTDEPVAMTDGEFAGFRRMTLTPRVVNAARRRAMLTTGASKADVVSRWLDGDLSLPASRLERTGTAVFLDPAAASRLATAR
jgi:6-phosphogluconolactonase/glucosamine-6-phosphate isomerase/deaminase